MTYIFHKGSTVRHVGGDTLLGIPVGDTGRVINDRRDDPAYEFQPPWFPKVQVMFTSRKRTCLVAASALEPG